MSNVDLEAIAQNLRVERELLFVADLLSTVEFVVFKGPLLTRRLYGELSSRTSSDNDILVREEDGRRALEVLLGAGFEPILVGLEPYRALVRVGQVALHIPGDLGRPSLDLHIRAFSRRFFDVEEAFIWQHLVERSLHGRTFFTFDDELLFCHLVAHYLQHLLEPPLLEDLRAGVRAIIPAVDLAKLERTLEKTVGTKAADFATTMAGLPWREFSKQGPLDLAGFVGGLSSLPRSSALRGAIVLSLVAPEKIPGALFEGLFPGQDELVARYGKKSSIRLHAEHWLHRFGLTRRASA